MRVRKVNKWSQTSSSCPHSDHSDHDFFLLLVVSDSSFFWSCLTFFSPSAFALLCSWLCLRTHESAAAVSSISDHFSRRWENPGLRPRLRLYSRSIKLFVVLSPGEENRRCCLSAKDLLLLVYVRRLIISASTTGRCWRDNVLTVNSPTEDESTVWVLGVNPFSLLGVLRRCQDQKANLLAAFSKSWTIFHFHSTLELCFLGQAL